jgi:type VI secretion system protein ImpM
LGQPPGFFGKVPSHGDFVGRRIPLDVRQRFDDWLQASLVRSQQDLGQAWLPTWLSSPLWRFVVGAGVCGDRAWAGVMMPSHDRVGRCFPLLLMAGIDGTPSLRDCMTVHDAWFGQMEELALSTLEEGFALELFDAALLALTSPGTMFRSPDAGPVLTGRAVIQIKGDVLPILADGHLEGCTAWWTDGSSLVEACLVVCAGLPESRAYGAFLDGRWEEHGWPGV